jgi:hypothetical protein
MVWRLLTEPAGWDAVFDIRIEKLVPPGTASEGQKVYGQSGPRLLRLHLRLQYVKIDADRHMLELDVKFPLGLNVREELNCIALDDARCRVNYRCEFSLPLGLRGALLQLILRRQFDRGPVDSLARLKNAAERAYRNQITA